MIAVVRDANCRFGVIELTAMISVRMRRLALPRLRQRARTKASTGHSSVGNGVNILSEIRDGVIFTSKSFKTGQLGLGKRGIRRLVRIELPLLPCR
jgi:hypothetical protein